MPASFFGCRVGKYYPRKSILNISCGVQPENLVKA